MARGHRPRVCCHVGTSNSNHQPFTSAPPVSISKRSHFMLEYWFKEKRTLVDFRRGLLGPHFDGFAAYLQAKGYARHTGCELLAKCCQFNGFLLEQRIARCDQLCAAHVEAFLEAY